MYTITRLGSVFVLLMVVVLVALPAGAAAVQPFTIIMSYSPGHCVRNYNGYGGSGSYAYTIPSDGMYYVDDLMRTVPLEEYYEWWAIVDQATYDPNVLFTTQALVYGDYSAPPVPVALSAGQNVLVLLVFNGGYTDISGCEADGHSMEVTGMIYDTTGLNGDAGTGELLAGPDLVHLPAGSVVGKFVVDTPLYYAPDPIAALPEVMTAGKTLWVTGLDASGRYYQVVLSGKFLWVPIGTIGPNNDAVWNNTPLSTAVVE